MGVPESESLVFPEDVSWHKEQCPHRQFVEDDRDRNILSQIEMEVELKKKYTADALLRRPRPPKPKKGARKTTSVNTKTLTSDEEKWVNDQVTKAMEPNGPIQSYLSSQRKEFQQGKEFLKNLCDCSKTNANVAVKAGPSKEPEQKKEVVAMKTEPLPTGGAENEEDGVLFF